MKNISNELHSFSVEAEETISSLKGKLGAKEVAFVKDGRVLKDEETFSSAGLADLATIDVVGLIPGGKVHGSLARAGKVKGQTPKVDAQEKKKKKTGRAARRQQYNRRFVNVVQTFGRRRGPNANS